MNPPRPPIRSARRAPREDAAARQVAARCAGMPLALCLACAVLASRRHYRIATMAAAPARGPITALAVEGERTMHHALDESYAALSGSAARPATCALPLAEAEHLLDVLIEANLVEELGPGRCRFHAPTRDHARARGERDSDAEREESLRGVIDWHLATATAAQRLLTPRQLTLERTYVCLLGLPTPFTGQAGALDWLDSRLTGLIALAEAACERGWHAAAWQLVDAMWPVFLRRRHYAAWIKAHQIGLAAARADRHPAAERQMLNSGAIGLSAAGDLDEAVSWYEAAYRAACAARDVRDQGQAQLGIGACHHDAGRAEEAARHLTGAIALWESCGYPRGVALARIVLGEAAVRRGEYQHATTLFAQAHSALIAANDPFDAARALAFLGHATALNGAHEDGATLLHTALHVIEQAGPGTHWQGRAVEMCGEIEHHRGRHARARAHYEQALAILETTAPRDAARVRTRLADLPSDDAR
ncbi:regulator [Streptomyces sp. NPDC057654]|uniref:regulator n=1 Tax=Streptomyces sp. NPDC057654 TaxID=3346196 RepID=UPI003688BC68